MAYNNTMESDRFSVPRFALHSKTAPHGGRYTSMKNQLVILLTLLIGTTSAVAAEYMPFPEARVTVEQWRAYYDAVAKELKASERQYEEHYLATFSDEETRMSFAFTLPGHEAHPAWITRQVVQDETGIDMRQIGYFAGDEEAFAELFRQYQVLTERTRKQLRR